MPFAASIALAVSLALNGSQPVALTTPVQSAMPAAQTVEGYVREYFADTPVMIEIARCESRFRQFDKRGDVLKNEAGSSAVGLFQIMASVHESTAKKLGLDIYTIQGNAAYARYLYDNYGTQPWQADPASEGCWGKTAAAKAHLALNK
jgi:hypothetical protein